MAALRSGMEASWDSSVGMQEVLFHALTLTVYGPEPSMLRLLACDPPPDAVFAGKK